MDGIIVYSVFCVIIFCNEFVHALDCDIRYEKERRVKIADCKNRGLTALPQHLPGDINVLDMSLNRLKIIGNNSFVNYRDLQELYLSQNQLSYLSDQSFQGLHKITILDMSGNILNLSKVYSAELFHPIKNLTKLDIRRNMPQPIDFVTDYNYPDHTFGILTELLFIGIDMMPLPHFESGFGQMTTLKELHFDSSPGTPPKNVRAISLSPSTALVKWDEPARPNGIIKGYKIFYTLEPDIPVVLWTTLDISIPQANERQTTITELKTNKTYSLCVLAYSKLGEGPISDIEQVMTKSGAEDFVFKTPITPGPSSINNSSSKINSKPVKRKKTVDDIYNIQHKVYKKELIKQDKEIEKLNLLIELLNSLRGNSSVSGSSSVNQLLFNCLLHT